MKESGRQPLPAALFLRAVALTAVEVGHLNGHWVQGEFRVFVSKHGRVGDDTRVGLGLKGVRDLHDL